MSDEEMDPIEREARARRRRTLLAGLFVLLGPPIAFRGWIAWSIQRDAAADRARDEKQYAPHTDDARILQTIEAVRARFVVAHDAWTRAATPEALAAIVAGAAPCPVRLTAPTEKAARAYVHGEHVDDDQLGNVHFRVWVPGDPIDDDLDGRRWSLKETEKQLKDHGAWRSSVARLDAWNKSLGEYVFVVGHSKQADIRGPAGSRTFTPGHLEGVAYVFSYDQGRVVCAAPVSVSNTTDDIEFKYQQNDTYAPGFVAAMGALGKDLDVRAMKAIAQSVRAVEARPAP